MSPAPRLVVFTRWPQAGRCKTRLIPALGAQGAADLHRRLAERTLAVVRAAGFAPEVRVTGADPAAFQGWLGAPARYVDQGEGDLGARLARAADPAPAVLIGTDAPDLAPAHLRAAAAALARAPAVIGPAADGGYWLLGLAAPMPQLFTDMAWSTPTVFAETVRRLRAHGAEPVVLDTLADLDRPEDLSRWPELAA